MCLLLPDHTFFAGDPKVFFFIVTWGFMGNSLFSHIFYHVITFHKIKTFYNLPSYPICFFLEIVNTPFLALSCVHSKGPHLDRQFYHIFPEYLDTIKG